MRPQAAVGKALKEKGLKAAFAESCTGGLLSSLVTDVPGSSDYFIGSIVAYDNDVKKSALGVKEATLKRYGAVSRQCAIEMAKGAKKALGADIALSITGIAGPGGGRPGKPVGTVFIAIAYKKRLTVKKFLFKGPRKEIKKQSALGALEMLSKALGLKTGRL